MNYPADLETDRLFTKTIDDHVFPTLGLGTFELAGDECRKAVAHALEAGYRHIDTARMYKNETSVGLGMKDAGLNRNDFLVTSKVWWDDLSPENIQAEIEASLRDLQTDYLDLALIHWPNPAYSLKTSIETLEKLKDSGKIRLYGVSNFTPSLFAEATDYGDIFANQVEYHPFLGQQQLLGAVRHNSSALIAYSPLAQGKVGDNSTLSEIGSKYGKNSQQVALRWLIEQDNVLAIPRSSTPEHIDSNLDIFDFELDETDHQHIAGLPKNQRIINPDFAPDWENPNEG